MEQWTVLITTRRSCLGKRGTRGPTVFATRGEPTSEGVDSGYDETPAGHLGSFGAPTHLPRLAHTLHSPAPPPRRRLHGNVLKVVQVLS